MRPIQIVLLIALSMTGSLGAPCARAADALDVRRIEDGQVPGPAQIAQLAWLTGQWSGQGLGGDIDEGFSAPRAGAIVGYFRLSQDGKPKFYEFEAIVEREGSLVFQVKHFNPDATLTGWEEKDKVVEFRLVAIDGQTAYFDGLTLSRSGDTLRGAIAFKQKDGSRRIESFQYERVK